MLIIHARLGTALLVAALTFPELARTAAAQLDPSTGLVIEKIVADSAAAKAGVKIGDRLLTYDNKRLSSPAALQAAEENTFGKREVILRIRRGQEVLTPTVPPGKLGIEARPELPGSSGNSVGR